MLNNPFEFDFEHRPEISGPTTFVFENHHVLLLLFHKSSINDQVGLRAKVGLLHPV